MAKLYFKYGAMGSSKTAQALITKFNYEERGLRVWLIKPAIDTREERAVCRSRIGLEAEVQLIQPDENIYEEFKNSEADSINVIIADECQFFSEEQIDELQDIVYEYDIPVLCFGLKTDFQTKLFPGSKRLFEIAESIQEIKTICSCGKKASVNARIDEQGNLITEGKQIEIGGNDRYVAMCYKCYKEKKRQSKQ